MTRDLLLLAIVVCAMVGGYLCGAAIPRGGRWRLACGFVALGASVLFLVAANV